MATWNLVTTDYVKARSVTPEDFGAAGTGVDDSAAIIDMLAYATANAGTGIYLAAGKTYGIASTAFEIPSYTHVWGSGTIKCLQDAPGGRGIIVIPANGAHDIVWDGPTIDGNFTTNANCIGSGAQNDTYPRHERIYIRCTVMNARVDPALEKVNNVLYSGGGKGVSVQGRTYDFYAKVTVINCDIGATIEAGYAYDRELENVTLDITSHNSRRTALYLQGSTPEGYGTAVSSSYKHGRLPGVRVNLAAYGGQSVNIVDQVTDIEYPNYELAGVITSQFATGVDVNAHIAVENRCTLLRGKMFGSTVRINALMDDLQHVWDARVIAGTGAVGTHQLDNVLTATVRTTTHSDVVIKKPGTGAIQRSQIDVSMWCENGVGELTSGTAGAFGASVDYRFRDMKASPVNEIVGTSSIQNTPTWAMAPSGGRVALQRESWPFLAYDEAPLVFGSGGTSRQWLWWDTTNSVLRLSPTAPVSATSGYVLAPRYGSVTAADGDTTPTVANCGVLLTANTGGTTITAFDDGYIGQILVIRFGDALTTVAHSSALRLQLGVNMTFAGVDTLTLIQHTTNTWTEISRSDTTA